MAGKSRLRTRLLAGGLFVMAGLVFAASALTAQGTDLRGGRAVSSRDLVARTAQRVAEQQVAVAQLQNEVADLTGRAGGGAELSAAQRTSSELLPSAGLTPVQGPGVRVTLDDASASSRDLAGNVPPNDLVVHQQDVQAVVNALWRGGASAVQVMDQRLIATSAVRCAGNTLLLQGRVYSPPFTITAVGDQRALRGALDSDPQVLVYREYVDMLGLGYALQLEPLITIPGYTGTITPHYAEVGS
jgi:uncharacterized protein YlxW (UPF0749 family)